MPHARGTRVPASCVPYVPEAMGSQPYARHTRAELEHARTCRVPWRPAGVSELPDIKIFHHGRPSNFEAAASTTNIVDIARWNAGHQQWKDQQWSRVIKIEGNDGLARAFEKEQMLLIAFTNHWCT